MTCCVCGDDAGTFRQHYNAGPEVSAFRQELGIALATPAEIAECLPEAKGGIQ